MKASEAARLLGIPYSTLHARMKDGTLKAEKLPNGFYEYDDDSVYALLRAARPGRAEDEGRMLAEAGALAGPPDPDGFADRWPYNLFADLFGKDEIFHAWPDRLDYLISQLPPRRQLVIRLRYQKRMTYKDIARDLDVSRERVRQILVRTLRTFRHPAFRNQLLSVPKDRHNQILRENARLERLAEYYKQRMEAAIDAAGIAPPPVEPDPPDPDILEERIEFLDLGVRSYNALYRANIDTVAQLVRLDPYRVMAIRNLGRKSFDEIVARLAAHGLELARREDG